MSERRLSPPILGQNLCVTLDNHAPDAEEVRAVARLLGCSPDQLTAIKFPGPGHLGESVVTLEAPHIERFTTPDRVALSLTDERFAVCYSSRDGSLVLVSHESGPLIFFILGGAGAATTVLRGASDLFRWVRARRATQRSANEEAAAVQYWFVEDGRLRSAEVLPADWSD
jgi:hypothetical protein